MEEREQGSHALDSDGYQVRRIYVKIHLSEVLGQNVDNNLYNSIH